MRPCRWPRGDTRACGTCCRCTDDTIDLGEDVYHADDPVDARFDPTDFGRPGVFEKLQAASVAALQDKKQQYELRQKQEQELKQADPPPVTEEELEAMID
jgi:hypothetical protein